MNTEFQKKKARELLAVYPEEYILEKINLIENSKNFHKGKIKNLSGLLIESLRSDYKAQTTNSMRRSREEASQKKAASHQKEVDNLRIYEKFLNNLILKNFQNQEEEQKKLILEQFVISLGKSIYRGIYDREGLSNILLQDQLCHYLKTNKKNFLDHLPTYEVFSSNTVNSDDIEFEQIC